MNPLSWLPPIPSWEGIHPLVIHFPVALLCVAPLHVFGMLVMRRVGTRDFQPALSMMVLGTLGTYVAFASGEATASVASGLTPAASALLERHAESAEDTRIVFTVLTVLYGMLLYGPAWFKKDFRPRTIRLLQAAFLTLYGGGLLVLAWTADKGGRPRPSVWDQSNAQLKLAEDSFVLRFEIVTMGRMGE